MVRVNVLAAMRVHVHAPQSHRTAHSACATFIRAALTDERTAILTLNAQVHDCFDSSYHTCARYAAANATRSLLAPSMRLCGLTTEMPRTRCRQPLSPSL